MFDTVENIEKDIAHSVGDHGILWLFGVQRNSDSCTIEHDGGGSLVVAIFFVFFSFISGVLYCSSSCLMRFLYNDWIYVNMYFGSGSRSTMVNMSWTSSSGSARRVSCVVDRGGEMLTVFKFSNFF